MPDIQGTCLCGRVTYDASGEAVFPGVCHCQNCQKGSGSAFSTVMAVPAADLPLTGPLTTFQLVGDSGNTVTRQFCAVCGSPVTTETAMMPGITMITVGTLNDPGWVKPSVQIYCDSAQPWVELGGGLAAFPKMPPAG